MCVCIVHKFKINNMFFYARANCDAARDDFKFNNDNNSHTDYSSDMRRNIETHTCARLKNHHLLEKIN